MQYVLAWKKKYPASKWPVIAFTGAPASFPVRKNHLHLHQYLYNWNDEINKMADSFIKDNLPDGPFVGVHLRNGVDFVSLTPINIYQLHLYLSLISVRVCIKS